MSVNRHCLADLDNQFERFSLIFHYGGAAGRRERNPHRNRPFPLSLQPRARASRIEFLLSDQNGSSTPARSVAPSEAWDRRVFPTGFLWRWMLTWNRWGIIRLERVGLTAELNPGIG